MCLAMAASVWRQQTANNRQQMVQQTADSIQQTSDIRQETVDSIQQTADSRHLDGRDVLSDGGVCANALVVHFRDQVRLRQQLGSRGAALSIERQFDSVATV
jgi:DNA integrity scanning protein DisA with diadenylate cyclase activity